MILWGEVNLQPRRHIISFSFKKKKIRKFLEKKVIFSLEMEVVTSLKIDSKGEQYRFCG